MRLRMAWISVVAPSTVWLTHYSPSLNRPEEYMDEVRRIFPRAEAGKDRKSIELDFEEA